MELSDGKITAKEWNAVLDKLIEIQQNRKANGQASIFGGGTDKTRNGWHNSFIVHPNQEIEFTADEIGQLYEAMGAKFTKASKPVTPAETSVAQPPADDTGKPEASEGTGQKPAGNVKEEKRTDENGNKTREVETGYNTDKPLYIREYDSEGNKTKETLLRGDGTTDNIYDYENGKVKTATYYNEDGKTPVKIIENDQLKMLKLKSKTENGATVINQYNFDENGVCTSSTLANSLHKQISGPSLNRNTIAFLKQLTPENVLKVLTSYEAMAGESLIDAISDEWGLNDEQFNDDMKVKDLIPTLVAERAKQLGFEPDENGQYNLDELFEADIQQSKESG